MKYLISRLEPGHYECIYNGYMFSLYIVKSSAVFVIDRGNTQRWLCEFKDLKKTIWADTKKSAIESAIKYLNKKQKNK